MLTIILEKNVRISQYISGFIIPQGIGLYLLFHHSTPVELYPLILKYLEKGNDVIKSIALHLDQNKQVISTQGQSYQDMGPQIDDSNVQFRSRRIDTRFSFWYSKIEQSQKIMVVQLEKLSETIGNII